MVHTNQPDRGTCIRNLDDIPWPAWDLVPLYKYLDHGLGYGVDLGRSMLILATRGCPYQCTFCSNPSMWTTRYMRPPADVVDEIEWLVSGYGANSLDFEDLTAIVKKLDHRLLPEDPRAEAQAHLATTHRHTVGGTRRRRCRLHLRFGLPEPESTRRRAARLKSSSASRRSWNEIGSKPRSLAPCATD